MECIICKSSKNIAKYRKYLNKEPIEPIQDVGLEYQKAFFRIMHGIDEDNYVIEDKILCKKCFENLPHDD